LILEINGVDRHLDGIRDLVIHRRHSQPTIVSPRPRPEASVPRYVRARAAMSIANRRYFSKLWGIGPGISAGSRHGDMCSATVGRE
jgi:hypothetical protein